MKKIIFVLLFIIGCSDFTLSQQNSIIWDKFEYLIGDWKSLGNSGDVNSYFSFQKDLNNKILVRKNHAEYPSRDTKPPIIHDDLLIIYPENGIPDKAVYFDNEEHTIYYDITFNETENSIVFTSNLIGDFPRFRLTYFKLDDENVNIRFEMTPPGNPDLFSTYLEGKAKKEK